MSDYQLAWRNIWRNRRRTLITAASVFFAVFFALVMRSFQLGAYDRIFKNVIESYSGYLQLQNEDYFDEPVLDNSFELSPEKLSVVSSDPNVIDIVPRLESFALAAAENNTQGVMVLGIDPAKEAMVTDMENRLVKYRLDKAAIESLKSEEIPSRTKELLDVFVNEYYTGEVRLMTDLAIAPGDSASVMPLIRRHASFLTNYLSGSDTTGALIGSGLSDYLNANTGDTIVIIGQGYHGTSAAGKYCVRGIVRLPAPDINNIVVYLPIKAAQALFAAPDMATSAVIRLVSNDDEAIAETAGRLSTIMETPLVTRTWREMNALMINQMEADNRSGMIMIGILYMVIAFGVFGTVLMMLAERRREFGMLVSIGMRKRKLALVVAMEMLFTGLLGVVTGIIASLPVVIYANVHPVRFTGQMAKMYTDYGFEPVMPTMLPDTYYLWQIFVVFVILSIAIFFSIRKILKLDVIKSLRC